MCTTTENTKDYSLYVINVSEKEIHSVLTLHRQTPE